MKNTKLLSLIILLIALVWSFYRFWDIYMLFFSSAITAYLLNPLVEMIVRGLKVKRPVAAFITALLFMSAIAALFFITLPALTVQLRSLLSDINKLTPAFEKTVLDIAAWLNTLSLPASLTSALTDILSGIDTVIISFIRSIAAAVIDITSHIFNALIYFIALTYFILDGEKLIRSLYSQLPVKIERQVLSMTKKADEITRKYIKSKVAISSAMAFVTFIGFTLLGVKYAGVFACFAFFLDFIPYFGSLIAGIVPIFYTLITVGVGRALAVLIMVLVIQQVEGNIVVPKVQGDLLGLHPITVMFSLLVCNRVWGPLGMLIAVPLAAVVKMAVGALYHYIISDLD